MNPIKHPCETAYKCKIKHRLTYFACKHECNHDKKECRIREGLI